MKHLSLATRYRPQLFSEVAGQPLAATALSRAAFEDKVAPAYLLSGTRGVGKTTIARIFAKALNCQNAPTAEPCNECPQCRHITAGNHVDVSEIDGASNTGVDDVRALRENIDFMPMEGRYKIFIVDEAHMLSKNAFNALLKTLEEPPSHTVFIFATTEAHRFPATIISRCQHFVFRHLPERDIYQHLVNILGREGVEYEEQAARLIARRAAGSVRDSLSLLDQALALGGSKLDTETVRSALGVAGPGLYNKLFTAIAACDCTEIIDLAGALLASGVDMGFFTREFGAMLRNLFLVRQTDGKILGTLANVSDDEKAFLKTQAPVFSAAHLHAAWQLALESQRGIVQSPEPGAALELLLLNVALLPKLLPVGDPALEKRQYECQDLKVEPGQLAEPPATASEAAVNSAVKSMSSETASETNAQNLVDKVEEDWHAFCEFCRGLPSPPPADILRAVEGKWQDGVLTIFAPSAQLWERLEKKRQLLEAALGAYCRGNLPKLEIPRPSDSGAFDKELAERCARQPEILLCKQILGAEITECIGKQNLGDKNA